MSLIPRRVKKIGILGLRGTTYFYIDFDYQTKERQYSNELAILNNRKQSSEKANFLAIHPQWIDTNLFHRWKSECDRRHDSICHAGSGIFSNIRPAWLIDTWQNRLVRATRADPYVALSYVWGEIPFVCTNIKNLDSFQEMGAFASCLKEDPLPQLSGMPFMSQNY